MNFNVYTETLIEQVSEEQKRSAADLKWVKRWKSESALRVRLVARGSFQEDESWILIVCLLALHH